MTPDIRFKGFADDWEQRKLGELAIFNPKENLPDKFEYVDLESVVGTEMLSHRTEDKTTAPSRAQRVAHTGDLFYQTVRPYQKNNYLFEKSDKVYVFSTGYAQLRPFIDGYFLLNLVQNEQLVKVVLDNCTGTSYPAINANDLAKIEVHIPKDDNESHKVGEVFRKLDNLIDIHQKKLKNLKSIKQSLLVGMFPQGDEKVPRIRFKGFSDDWNYPVLGTLGKTYTGLSGKTKEDFGHGDATYITYMNVFTNPITHSLQVDSIESDAMQNEVQEGDIFFTTSSETPEEVGMSSVLLAKSGTTYLNSFCFGYRLNENVKIDKYYLAYLLRSPVVREKIVFLAQGISRFNISKTKMMEIAIPVPEKTEEQEKIGAFFFNLDKLIEAQEKKIAQLKNIKSALLNKMFPKGDE